MNKKLIFSVLLVSLLAFGLVLSGCDTGSGGGGGTSSTTGGGGETWSKITAVSQVTAGNWGGTATDSKNLKTICDSYGISMQGADADFAKITVSAACTVNFTITASKVTLVSGSVIYTYTDASGNIGNYWSEIVKFVTNDILKDQFGPTVVVTNVSNKSITGALTNEDATSYVSGGNWQINNTKTRIKLLANEWYKGSPEMFLNKK